MANDYIDQWNATGVPYDIHDKGRAQPNGVATLDADGRLPYSQLPESAVELKGYWNANTNTPTLVDGTGTTGDEYYVDVAGSQNLGSGTQYFNVGDRILYIDGIWKNINSTAVKSVNGVLPNAQGDVNILNKVYPVGSIYQNISDSTNPAVLFGIGTWEQITDKFLACKGSTFVTDGGGTYTLTEANIPLHNHGGYTGNSYTGITATENLDASAAGVSIFDPGHVHEYIHAFGGAPYFGVPAGEGGAGFYWGSDNYGSSTNYTGITATHYHAHSITDKQHTHTISNYGWATPTAIDIVPKYQAVYTWKRTA